MRFPLNNQQPGILGPMTDYPTVASCLNHVAETILVSDHPGVTLKRWEREFLAHKASAFNQTAFCLNSHLAAAIGCYKNEEGVESWDEASISLYEDVRTSLKMQALEVIVHLTCLDSKAEIPERIYNQAVEAGGVADVHLAIAIASAFCMFNRYVDMAGNPSLRTAKEYQRVGEMLAEFGYEKIEDPVL